MFVPLELRGWRRFIPLMGRRIRPNRRVPSDPKNRGGGG